jgi:hypothetical protein
VRNRSLWLLALLLALAAGPAFAQGGAGSTGSIQGEVVDESGGVLPGVSVTATGTTMLGSQTAVTNAQGVFRFLGVPAGTYKLTFDLQGFNKRTRDDIRVGIGFTATVNERMSVKAMTEEVTVTGESTPIDTTATRVQTNFDKNMLDSLPNARDMWSLLAETPAVQLNRFDVGGSTAGTQTTYVAYGNGGQNRPLIEGINTTEGTSAAGFYFDYGSFDEVIIGAAGNSAEMPSGGVLTNFIGKSGGNRFGGEVYYEYENGDFLQSKNITQDQLNRGYANIPKAVIDKLGLKRDEANTLLSYKNLNASIGGPLMKDKLWFWAGYLRQEGKVFQPPSGAILDGTEFLTKLTNYTGKLTFQITPKDKLIGYLQYGIKLQPFRTDAGFVGGPRHLTSASTLKQDSPSWVGKLEYNRTFGDRGFLEIRGGEFGYNFALVGNDQTTPRREDRATLEVTGGGRDWQLDRRRKQLHGAYTFFVDNVMGGNHQFKIGGEVQHETGRTRWKQYYTNNVLHVLNNGAANLVRLGLPVDSWNGLRNYGLFVNDAYKVNRLTLNVGVRYDRYRVFLPDQERPASTFSPQAATFPAVSSVKTFNHVVPRLGVIYDITGDGKTLWKANFGRYYFNPGVGLADSVNPNTGTQFSEYTWNDLNGDRIWQPGESGTLQQVVGGSASITFDPNLRNSFTNELSTWLERDLGANIGMRAGFVWKMDRDGYQRENVNRPLSAWTIATSVTDPGPDGSANTGDERTVSAFGLPADVLARPVENRVFNIDAWENDYRTFELGATKRFSNRWNMVSSFSITWFDEYGTSYFGSGPGNNVGASGTLFGSFAGNSNFPITPNGKADKTKFSQWNFKVHGTYAPGWDVRITPILRIQQGFPYGRVFTATVTGQSQNFQAEDVTARRLETIKQLDFRIEKKIKLTGNAKLGVLFDLFNVFNANTVLNLNARTGRLTISETNVNVPTFESPSTILPPRIARISGRLEW